MSAISHLGSRAVVYSLVTLYLAGGALILSLTYLLNSPDVDAYLTADMDACQWWFFFSTFWVWYPALYYFFKHGGICKGVIIDTLCMCIMLCNAMWNRKDGMLILLNLIISISPMIPRSLLFLKLLLQGMDRIREHAPQCVPYPSPLPDCPTQKPHIGRLTINNRRASSSSQLPASKSDSQIVPSDSMSSASSADSTVSEPSSTCSQNSSTKTCLLDKSRRSWSVDAKLFSRFCHQKLFSGRLCSGVLSASDSEGTVYIRKNDQGNYCRSALDLRLGAIFVLSRVVLSYYTGIVVMSYASLSLTKVFSILHLIFTVLGIVEAFQMERAPRILSFFRLN